MTYNQLLSTLQTLLESNAMIATVKNVTPIEWLNRDEQPVYPVAAYTVLNATSSIGKQIVYSVQIFFLDRSGAEAEFEPDVISDQLQIANDILEKIRGVKQTYFFDDSVTINFISDKYEDYLAGVEMTINITTQSDFDGCDFPT